MEGLARSLMVKRQRRLLDEIGVRTGTPVVYLKAAWADPVLYGGRGERSGTDIDVLVSPKAYGEFADELVALGFQRQPTLTLHATRGEAFRAMDGQLDVDLHRGIGQPPWFRLDDSAVFARAQPYGSPDGPILGLSPSDQIVHLVAHYANARFALDDRHLNDALRVIDRFSIDWNAIADQCQRGFLEVAFHIVCRLLRRRGIDVPPLRESLGCKWRRLALSPLLDAQDARRIHGASRAVNDRIDLFVFLPLVSTWLTALPRLLLAVASDRIARHRQLPG